MRIIFFIISLLLLLPSCRKGEAPSSSDTDQDIGNVKPMEVRLSTNLSVSVENQSLGRAPIYGDKLPEGYTVGVYGILADEDDLSSCNINKPAQTAMSNAQYEVKSDGSMVQENFAEYPVDNDGLMFYAYYPYTETRELLREGNNKYISITFPTDDMSSAVDYLYIDSFFKKTPTDYSSNVANLNFKHALSMLRLNFKGTSSNVIVSSVTVAVKANPKGKFYINNGDCVPKDTYSNEYYFTETADLIDGDFSLDLLMYPDVVIDYISCLINDSQVFIYDDTTVSEDRKIKLVKGQFVQMNLTYIPKDTNFSNSLENWTDSNQNQDYEIDGETGTVTQN